MRLTLVTLSRVNTSPGSPGDQPRRANGASPSPSDVPNGFNNDEWGSGATAFSGGAVDPADMEKTTIIQPVLSNRMAEGDAEATELGGSSGMTPLSEHAEESGGGKKSGGWRGARGFLWVTLAVLGLGGILYGADYAMSEGNVPRGVTVGGVDIGGLSTDGAEQRLRNELKDLQQKQVKIQAGELSTNIEPIQAGLKIDWNKTIAKAGQQPLNPVTRLKSLWEKREVGIESDYVEGPFKRAVDRVVRELSREPKNAELRVNPTGAADIVPDHNGQQVDRGLAERFIRENWLNTQRVVTIPATRVDAAIRQEAADAAVRDFLVPATERELVFMGRRDINAKLTAPDFAQILSFKPEGEGFVPIWNNDAAKSILSKQLASTEVKFRNASFETVDGGLRVIPSQDGVEIDWDATMGDFPAKALDRENREHEVVYQEKAATYTTEQAEKARFDDVVGEFTTGGFAYESGLNIRRIAETVNGTIVLPGETFSIYGVTGPRGEAQGYINSGVIQNGRPGKAVGGGISQFATTLYNASYFAGMEDVEHHAHDYYISRYPAGREATLWNDQLDLKFKNPFPTPVLIQASADSSTVTARLRGVKYVNVESIAGPRTDYTEPSTQVLSGSDCYASSGAPGFTVTDTRIVRNLDGSLRSRETKSTKYAPQPRVICSG